MRVHGEVWRAVAPAGADAGDDVIVERVEGDLTLLVNRK